MGLQIFIYSLLIIPILFLISSALFLVKKKVIKKEAYKNADYLSFIDSFFSRKIVIKALIIPTVILIVFFVTPYLMQVADENLIREHEANIKLYEDYSEDYAEAARQQIEEYQRFQSEMAGRATIQQLQFWAEQEDSVGNSLTDKIQEFQDLILQQELEINAARARIEGRLKNKLFFGLE